MSTPSALAAERTDQVRTFLTGEAAAAAARPAPSPARRRLAAGALAALLLGGGLVAASAVGGPAPSAVALETADGWTTIRLVDVDADPDAVVAELEAAGFAAERRDPGTVAAERRAGGGSPTAVVAVAPEEHGVLAHGVAGITGLSVDLGPALADVFPAAPDGSVDAGLEALGVRFGPDGSVSLRRGAAVTLLVLAPS